MVGEDVQLYSGFSLLMANKTVEMRKGSKIRSPKRNSCNIWNNNVDQYTCMGKNAKQADSLDYQTMVDRFQEQFPEYGAWLPQEHMHFENLWGGLMSNYTSYIVSLGNMNLTGASITVPKVGLCAANLNMQQSEVDSSGQGCGSDYGIGSGQKYATCAGSGGSNGGLGGKGGIEDNQSGYQDLCKEQITMQAYDYGLNPSYEGSGGASGTKGEYLGGSGGGIVRINVLNELKMG